MSIFPLFFPTPTRLLNRVLTLLVCLGVTIVLAESCVKQPKWEPTPGVSPKGIEFGSISRNQTRLTLTVAPITPSYSHASSPSTSPPVRSAAGP